MLFIIVCTLVSNIVIVCIPAFYSSDELEKLDFLQQYGFAFYAKTFFKIFDTQRFEVPVRPLGYLVWALALSPMPEYPFLVHLFDVLMHSFVACLLFLILYRYTNQQRKSIIAALFFAVSPLTMLSVGWSGAIFDRLYVFFILCVLYFFLKYQNSTRNLDRGLYAACMLASSAAAISSKETAVILPLLILLVILWLRLNKENIDIKATIVALITSSVPVVTYVLLRIKPLFNSFLMPAIGGYSTSITNLPSNAIVYFSFPFFIPLLEAHTYFFFPRTLLIAAIAIHVIVVFLVYKRRGVASALLYFAFYFVFLIPVLAIKGLASHYLYGSGLVLAIAMAFLLSSWKQHFLSNTVVCVLFVALLFHTFALQKFLYDSGTCQAKILTSFDVLSKSLTKKEISKGITITAAPNSRKYVLQRSIFGRHRFGNFFGVNFEVVDCVQELKEDISKPILHFDESCNIFMLPNSNPVAP